MRRFCKDLKDHATKIIDFMKKIITPLTKEEKDNYNKENICHICKKEFNNDTTESSSLELKVRDIAISKANIGELHIIRVI